MIRKTRPGSCALGHVCNDTWAVWNWRWIRSISQAALAKLIPNQRRNPPGVTVGWHQNFANVGRTGQSCSCSWFSRTVVKQPWYSCRWLMRGGNISVVILQLLWMGSALLGTTTSCLATAPCFRQYTNTTNCQVNYKLTFLLGHLCTFCFHF